MGHILSQTLKNRLDAYRERYDIEAHKKGFLDTLSYVGENGQLSITSLFALVTSFEKKEIFKGKWWGFSGVSRLVRDIFEEMGVSISRSEMADIIAKGKESIVVRKLLHEAVRDFKTDKMHHERIEKELLGTLGWRLNRLDETLGYKTLVEWVCDEVLNIDDSSDGEYEPDKLDNSTVESVENDGPLTSQQKLKENILTALELVAEIYPAYLPYFLEELYSENISQALGCLTAYAQELVQAEREAAATNQPIITFNIGHQWVLNTLFSHRRLAAAIVKQQPILFSRVAPHLRDEVYQSLPDNIRKELSDILTKQEADTKRKSEAILYPELNLENNINNIEKEKERKYHRDITSTQAPLSPDVASHLQRAMLQVDKGRALVIVHKYLARSGISAEKRKFFKELWGLLYRADFTYDKYVEFRITNFPDPATSQLLYAWRQQSNAKDTLKQLDFLLLKTVKHQLVARIQIYLSDISSRISNVEINQISRFLQELTKRISTAKKDHTLEQLNKDIQELINKPDYANIRTTANTPIDPLDKQLNELQKIVILAPAHSLPQEAARLQNSITPKNLIPSNKDSDILTAMKSINAHQPITYQYPMPFARFYNSGARDQVDSFLQHVDNLNRQEAMRGGVNFKYVQFIPTDKWGLALSINEKIYNGVAQAALMSELGVLNLLYNNASFLPLHIRSQVTPLYQNGERLYQQFLVNRGENSTAVFHQSAEGQQFIKQLNEFRKAYTHCSPSAVMSPISKLPSDFKITRDKISQIVSMMFILNKHLDPRYHQLFHALTGYLNVRNGNTSAQQEASAFIALESNQVAPSPKLEKTFRNIFAIKHASIDTLTSLQEAVIEANTQNSTAGVEKGIANLLKLAGIKQSNSVEGSDSGLLPGFNSNRSRAPSS